MTSAASVEYGWARCRGYRSGTVIIDLLTGQYSGPGASGLAGHNAHARISAFAIIQSCKQTTIPT
jgi:hypothetical protein